MIISEVHALTNAELQARKEQATPRGIAVTCEFFVVRAENAELWDVEGRRFIDFSSGISVNNVGHRHPKVVRAIRQQLDCFIHTAYQVVPYPSLIHLAERINQLTPGTHRKKTAFFSTGAEAVENTVKIARVATGRPAIISFTGAFHGRTMMSMALTGKMVPYKVGFGPFPGEVFHAPFPNALHGVSVEDSLAGLQYLFKADVDPKRVAAVLLEPVQGEGGFYVAPAEFIRAVRALCDQHGMLLIADEIQTGFGRTGKMFAMEHYELAPDLMSIAKSLGGGLPISAVCGRAEIMDAALPGGLGGTYAGNPLAVAAAHAVLDIFVEEDLVARANLLGERLKVRLSKLHNFVPQIAEVRGLGAMVAMEFCHPGTSNPDPEFAKAVQARALNGGLIVLLCGVYSNVIRFLFPLTIPDNVFEEALNILESALLYGRQVIATV
ncbi:MAG: 4-aminobutyrate--2-oxoglutarate transaminase [Candidatus Korobacteraceae bacterium]|jgi:4-aminobutyrate aminotransferase